MPRFQYNLRTVLIFTTICAALLGFSARWAYKAEKQRRAVENLERNGWVYCIYGDDTGILGSRFLDWRFRITEVRFEREVTDSDIQILQSLDGLKRVRFYVGEEAKLRAALPNCEIESPHAGPQPS